MNKKFNLTTYAKHDTAHCLAPNLFRQLKSGERKKEKLDVLYKYSDKTLRFTGFEPLDAGDMRVLQALVAMGGPSTIILDFNDVVTETAKTLMGFLNPNNYTKDTKAKVINANLSSLLAEIGLSDGGAQRKVAMDSLFRLSNVVVTVETENQKGSCNLLSYCLEKNTKRLYVALNPRITKAILGENGGQFTTIDMSEVRKIKGDLSAILHQRLCAIVDNGQSKILKVDTLIGYIWGKEPLGEATDKQSNVIRQRRYKLNKSINELEATGGWKFTVSGGGSLLVIRKLRKFGNIVNQDEVALEVASIK